MTDVITAVSQDILHDIAKEDSRRDRKAKATDKVHQAKVEEVQQSFKAAVTIVE